MFFPTCLQWFWLMNSLNTKILNAIYVRTMGPLEVEDEGEEEIVAQPPANVDPFAIDVESSTVMQDEGMKVTINKPSLEPVAAATSLDGTEVSDIKVTVKKKSSKDEPEKIEEPVEIQAVESEPTEIEPPQ